MVKNLAVIGLVLNFLTIAIVAAQFGLTIYIYLVVEEKVIGYVDSTAQFVDEITDFSGQISSLKPGIDKLARQYGGSSEGLQKRLDALDGRLESLDKRLSGLEGSTTKLSDDVTGVRKGIDKILKKF